MKLMVNGSEIRPWAAAPRGTLVTIGIVQDSRITVPDLTGKSAEEAKTILEKDQLKTGTVKEKESEEGTPGLIIRQTPSAGEKVKEGTQVNLR